MMDIIDEFKRMNKQINDLSKAMIIDPFDEDFFDVFTKKRMELVKEIMNQKPQSIRELSQQVERDIKNVFEDLKLLQHVNIIDFERIGRCKRPIVKSKTIIFKFSRGDEDE